MPLLTKDNVRGVFPPIVTPMYENEEINFDQFRDELRMMLSLPITGMVIGGSTGEGYALSVDELGTLVGIAVEEAAGRIPVVGGIITTTTRDAVARARACRDAGAVGLMVTPPIYQKASPENLLAYFGGINEQSGLPIIIYNVLPAAPVAPETMLRIAALPGVIGTKESAGSSLTWLSELVERATDSFAVTWATDHMLFPGFALGAVGSISGFTSLFPRESCVMFDAIQRNDYDAARRIHYALNPLMRPVMTGDNWPGKMKVVFNLLGRNVGPCRQPFTAPIGADLAALEAGVEQIKRALAELALTV
ncbi:MAG: dihydrodipicolinate synthase family protein [Thermomicrobiales bacterium]